MTPDTDAREAVAKLAAWAKEHYLSDVEFIIKDATPLGRPAIAICAEIRNATRLPDTVSLEALRSEALAQGWTERKPKDGKKDRKPDEEEMTEIELLRRLQAVFMRGDLKHV